MSINFCHQKNNPQHWWIRWISLHIWLFLLSLCYLSFLWLATNIYHPFSLHSGYECKYWVRFITFCLNFDTVNSAWKLEKLSQVTPFLMTYQVLEHVLCVVCSCIAISIFIDSSDIYPLFHCDTFIIDQDKGEKIKNIKISKFSWTFLLNLKPWSWKSLYFFQSCG